MSLGRDGRDESAPATDALVAGRVLVVAAILPSLMFLSKPARTRFFALAARFCQCGISGMDR
jgi:hypothetical protein